MSMGEHTVRADTRDRSTAELVRQVSDLVPRLVRQEMELAKIELAEKGKRAGAGAGLIGGGGLVALYGGGALVAAGVLGLAHVVAAWLAALIVAVALFAVAGVAALVARSQVRRAMPPVPEEAVASTKEDVRTVKESARR
jgi:uncharacterized membrane protein YqjE